MKYFLCLLALSVLCASAADAAFAPAPQQTQVDRGQAAEAGHHPLIDVKFVLRQAPAEQDQTPRIEFGENRSSAGPMQIGSMQRGSMQEWGLHALSLNPGYGNPNADVCSGWACRGYLVSSSAAQGGGGR